MTQCLYRYWKAYSTVWEKNVFGTMENYPIPKVYLSKFPILSQTPSTYKIMGDDGRIRHVLKGDGKRYAHETKEQAWHSFQRRLTKEHAILLSRLELVRGAQAKTMNDIESEFVELT